MHDHAKVMLISADDSHTFDSVIRVTSHHNLIEDTEERHPRLRFGRAHVFNNVIARWRWDSMRSHLGGQLLVENNVFEQGESTQGVRALMDGNVRATGNLTIGEVTISEANPEAVFVASEAYAYDLEAADMALIERVRAGAGWRDTPLPPR